MVGVFPGTIKIFTTMSLQHHSTLLNHQAGGTSAILPSQEVMRVSHASQPLAFAVSKLVLQEFAVVAGTAYLASVLAHEAIWRGSPPSFQLYIAAALFLAAAVESIALGFGHYKNSQSQPRHVFLFSGFAAVALAFSFLLSALFLLKITELYSRATFVFQFIMVEFAVLAARAFFHARLQASIASGLVNARRVVLIGDPAKRAEFANRLKATGIQTVGSFSFPAVRDSGVAASERAERESRELIEGCRRLKPDDILVLARQDDVAELSCLMAALSEVPVGLHVVLIEAATFLAAARIVEFGNVLTMQVLRPPLSQLQGIAKRVFDVAAAAAGLLMLSPLLIAVAIAVKLDSRGPVFFRQRRHGYNNETIEVFKFRSMKVQREEGEKFVQAVRNDSRITRVGAFLRRTNIDELPQLINVLHGEMSIVGPRPHATSHNRMFEDKINVFSRRHVVKPGITGWAQVNGCRGITDTLEKMQERVEHDLYYIDNWSFWFDLRIIVMTVFSKTAYENAY
jgi:Undecaprenyl-phosphate glucose phosphotransferase